MGGTEGGTSILETPPYVIALVFFFFLVVSLGFEKILHFLRHALQKRGKQGLVSAMNNMQSELMCLGVATLILLLFQSNITSYCINTKSYTKTWLDHVSGCSCCLSRTKGVSPCYYAAKSCISESTLSECCNPEFTGEKTKVCSGIFDDSDDWEIPNTQGVYTVNSLTGDVSTNSSNHRRLQGLATMRALLGGSSGSQAAVRAAEEVQCDGRVQTGWEECQFRPNYRPAIGPTALHQVHMFIFITAIVHIALGVALIIIAGLRLRIWRRGRGADDENARMVQEAVDEHSKSIDAVATAGKLESQPEDAEMESARNLDSFPANAKVTELPAVFEIERKVSWRGRPEKIRGFRQYCWEIFVCIGRQFIPNVVTKEEFSIMRSAFMLTHHICSNSNFNFQDYLRTAMEDDFSHVVGLGFPMWCFIIIFVLLSSAIGWCIWVFVIISGFLLAVVNTKLIWIVRYVTRGGHVHKLKPGIFWLNRPWLLLPVIKFLLFFVSYVYANAIFFAAEFGSTSCFFSSVGFQGQPVPWWLIMVVNTIFLLSLSLLTLPLYSITVQMGGDFKAHLLPKSIVDNALKVHSMQVSDSKGFRRLVSSWLPKQRDAPHPAGEHPAASLVHNAAPSLE